jgi:hypothetical protein
LLAPLPPPCAAIYNAVGRADASRDTIRYALSFLGDRVANATEWLVVLKCLMVVHRMMREAEGDRFRTLLADMLFGGRGQGERRREGGGGSGGSGGSGGGLCLFNLGGFKDDSSPEAWEMSGWVRSYALYLEERCAVLADTRCDPQAEAPNAPSASRAWSGSALLQNLPRLQGLLRRLVDVLPRLPRLHIVAAAAATDTLRETRLLFRSVSDGVINLVDQFFDMPTHEATQALDMYRRAVRQVADLNSALRSLVSHEQFAAELTRMPLPFDPPPADFLKVMEDYINAPPGANGLKPRGRPSTSRDGPPSPPVYTLTPSLPPAAVARAPAPEFDLLGGVEELALAPQQQPPPLPPHHAHHGGGHAPPPPPPQQQQHAHAPVGGDLFDLLSAPEVVVPAQLPAPPAPPVAAAPAQHAAHAPPPVLNKNLLDSLYDSAAAAPPGGVGAFGGMGGGMGGGGNPFGAFEAPRGMGGPPPGAYRMAGPPPQQGGPYGGMAPPFGGMPPPQQQQQPNFFGAAAQQQQPFGASQPFGAPGGGYGGSGGFGAPPAAPNPFAAIGGPPPPLMGAAAGMPNNLFDAFGAPSPHMQQQQQQQAMFGAPQQPFGAQPAQRPPPSTNPFA